METRASKYLYVCIQIFVLAPHPLCHFPSIAGPASFCIAYFCAQFGSSLAHSTPKTHIHTHSTSAYNYDR